MIQTDDQPRMMTALLLGEDDEPVSSAFVLRRFTLLEGGLALEFGRDSGEEPEALAVVGTIEDAWRTIGAIALTAAAAKLRMQQGGTVTEAGKRRAAVLASEMLRRMAEEMLPPSGSGAA